MSHQEAFRQIFSAVHHMERIGFELAEQYCEFAGSEVEREFAQAQRREEGRHVAVCRGLAREFGELEPPSAHLGRMRRALVEAPRRSSKLLGLLGGDIMGDFLIRRLLTPHVSALLPPAAKELLREVLSDEVKHIAFLRPLLREELAAQGPAARASCIWTQIVLLRADLGETARLSSHFEAIGLVPRVESVMCYLYYRRQCAELRFTGSLVMLPAWLVRVAGPATFRAAERGLEEMVAGGTSESIEALRLRSGHALPRTPPKGCALWKPSGTGNRDVGSDSSSLAIAESRGCKPLVESEAKHVLSEVEGPQLDSSVPILNSGAPSLDLHARGGRGEP